MVYRVINLLLPRFTFEIAFDLASNLCTIAAYLEKDESDFLISIAFPSTVKSHKFLFGGALERFVLLRLLQHHYKALLDIPISVFN